MFSLIFFYGIFPGSKNIAGMNTKLLILPILLVHHIMVSYFIDISEKSKEWEKFNRVAFKEVGISGVNFGENQQEVIKKFGKPDSIFTKVNEFEGDNYLKFFYGTSGFNFENEKFSGFCISNDSFSFEPGKIKTGDKTEKLQEQFPRSFSNPYEGEGGTKVKVRIDETDSYVIFTCYNGIITKFETWDDL